MNSVRFTDQLTLQLLGHFGDHWIFKLHLPLFVWLAHGHNPLLGNEIEPLFYIDSDAGELWAGAAREACEEAWRNYFGFLDNGIPDQLVRQILPVNLMSQGSVTFTAAELLGFVQTHRDSPITELALIAQGYERALTDGDRNSGRGDHSN